MSMDADSPFAAIPYHHQTEFLLADDSSPISGETPPGDPVANSWFRFSRPPLLADGAWEPTSLALPGDILGTAVHAGVGSDAGFFLVISLQISLQIVAEMRTEWLLQHTRAHVAADGYAAGTTELWDSEGTLVAIATQCAKLQVMKRG
jgi:acyl-CoA thioesterase